MDENSMTNSPDMSFIGLFLQSGPVVQAVMIALFAASFIVWGAYIDARRTIARFNKEGQRFEQLFMSSPDLSSLMSSLPDQPTNPKMAMLFAALEEWQQWDKSERTYEAKRDIIGPRLFQAMIDSGREMLDGPQKKMPIFSTIGATAPFVGLFGTVWGVMNSFRAIGEIGSTSLAVVAPGIAEALLATALGLLAAIPAVIFNNLINQKLASEEEDLHRFAHKINFIFLRNNNGG